jgi:hypothetical protein
MKTRSGDLFKRNGIYSVQWRVDGKLFMRSTRKRIRKEAEIARYEEEKSPALKISGAFRVFFKAPNRSDSSETTLQSYEYQFKTFAKRAGERGIVAMRDISDEADTAIKVEDPDVPYVVKYARTM